MKKNIWIWVSIVLFIITVGVIIISVIGHIQLKKFEEAYILNGQDLICKSHTQIIDDLSSELVSAKEALESNNANELDVVLNDVMYVLKTFYTINEENPSNDRYTKLKDYVTEDYADYISRLSTVAANYMQAINIQDTFYSKLTDTQARVLVFCTISIQSERWGNVSESKVYDITAKYHTGLKKWQVDSMKVGEDVNFQNFKTA